MREDACQKCLNKESHWAEPNCLPNRFNLVCVEHGCRLAGGHRCNQKMYKDEPQYSESQKGEPES
jgi:hypothetical protein